MKPSLTLQEFTKLTQEFDVVPLLAVRPDDLETAVSAFLKIRKLRGDFLFESVVGGEKWGRFSFLGTDPVQDIKIWQDGIEIQGQGRTQKQPFHGNPLKELLSFCNQRVYVDPRLPRFAGGLVGYLGYDLIQFFEKVRLSKPQDPALPLAHLMLFDRFYAFDNFSQNIFIVAVWVRDLNKEERPEAAYARLLNIINKLQSDLDKPTPNLPVRTEAVGSVPDATGSLSEAQYMDCVDRCKKYIVEGDIFQVVPSVRFEVARGATDSFDVYRALRRINPSPYMYHIDFGPAQVVGASPEILVRLDQGGRVAVRPIAGTRRRGKDLKEDFKLEHELLEDSKENSGHIMLVDLGRNDLGRIAKPGTVQVDELRSVERYSHVMHLVSHVSGELLPDKDIFDVIAATFPAGTLSGAPKIRAMEIIEEMEPVARGVFGGAVGYIGFSGVADLAIAIRTSVLTQDKIFIQAGAGVVYQSDPRSEYQECQQKAGALLAALKTCYRAS